MILKSKKFPSGWNRRKERTKIVQLLCLYSAPVRKSELKNLPTLLARRCASYTSPYSSVRKRADWSADCRYRAPVAPGVALQVWPKCKIYSKIKYESSNLLRKFLTKISSTCQWSDPDPSFYLLRNSDPSGTK